MLFSKKRTCSFKLDQFKFILFSYSALILSFILCLIFLTYLAFPQKISNIQSEHYQKYKALPAASFDLSQTKMEIGKSDGRSLILANFFKKNKSPLEKQASIFIYVADKYQIDYKLLPAIAMEESNGGKTMKYKSNNPFGNNIFEGESTSFDSVEEAIDLTGQLIKSQYIDQDLKSPLQIASKFTNISLGKASIWNSSVSSYLEQI